MTYLLTVDEHDALRIKDALLQARARETDPTKGLELAILYVAVCEQITRQRTR